MSTTDPATRRASAPSWSVGVLVGFPVLAGFAGQSEATLATWYVDDLDTIVDERTAAAVRFARYDQFEHDTRGVTPRAGGGRIAWFQDPDGNTFALESDR